MPACMRDVVNKSVLTVILVNYRRPDLVTECLETLERERSDVPALRVIVVDNGSTDDSVGRIDRILRDRGWGTWVRLVPLAHNLGFAGGNNRGLDVMESSDYVLFLNSDTLVHSGCLRRALEAMEEDADIGFLSVRLEEPSGVVQNTARKFPTPLRCVIGAMGLPWRWPRIFGWADIQDLTWDRMTEIRNVDWIGGAFILTRQAVLEQVGGWDEDFFFYGEDVEFCHRVRRAGWAVRYDPRGSITHLGGASSDPTRLPSDARDEFRWKARYLIQRKCYGRWAEWMVRCVDNLRRMIRPPRRN